MDFPIKSLPWILVIAVACLIAPAVAQAGTVTDFVFIVDATGSMNSKIASVRNGLSSFVSGLDANSIDYRFSVVLFGGAPELILDWTSNAATAQNALNAISSSSAVTGKQNNHNVNPEAGLEAIRILLGGATNNTLLTNNVFAAASISNFESTFRSNARKNLILVTDEDSDAPFYVDNRWPGQTYQENPPASGSGTEWVNAWQAEIDATAGVVIGAQAYLNMLIYPGDLPTSKQYGNPGSDVSGVNLLGYDPAATLTKLQNDGFGASLQAQVLDANLIARSFNISLVNNTTFVNNFFAAKLEEVTTDPGVNSVPLPSAAWLGLGMLSLLAVARRRRRVLSHN